MTRASEHVNQLPLAQHVRIRFESAETMSELIASTAKSLDRALKMFPYDVPGARRAIRTLSIKPEREAIYEVYYLSTTAWDRTH